MVKSSQNRLLFLLMVTMNFSMCAMFSAKMLCNLSHNHNASCPPGYLLNSEAHTLSQQIFADNIVFAAGASYVASCFRDTSFKVLVRNALLSGLYGACLGFVCSSVCNPHNDFFSEECRYVEQVFRVSSLVSGLGINTIL